ncbi:MAG TPA: hypothetical protein VNQ77_11040 [Frankiaceae bacterium]|nr:hypothetical protein [Frankiaceae bacterium]
MRLTLLALGVAAAGLVPAAPASASCNTALYVTTGRCENHCTIAAAAYSEVRTASGDAPPPFGPCAA